VTLIGLAVVILNTAPNKASKALWFRIQDTRIIATATCPMAPAGGGRLCNLCLLCCGWRLGSAADAALPTQKLGEQISPHILESRLELLSSLPSFTCGEGGDVSPLGYNTTHARKSSLASLLSCNTACGRAISIIMWLPSPT
jgi:hypothetical protein